MGRNFRPKPSGRNGRRFELTDGLSNASAQAGLLPAGRQKERFARCDYHICLTDRIAHPRAIGVGQQEMVFPATDPDAPLDISLPGRVSDLDRLAILTAHGLTLGDRVDHSHCPIHPDADATSNNDVYVLDNGLYCQHCAGLGHMYGPGFPAGFVPWSALGGKVSPLAPDLRRLADNSVHWTHARLDLAFRYPHLSEELREQIFRLSLEQVWQADEHRIKMVFNPDLNVVWTDGQWLSSVDYSPTKVTQGAARDMPYALGTDEDPLELNRSRQAHISECRSPFGYLPVYLYKGFDFFLEDTDQCIPVATDETEYPFVLPSQPMELDVVLDRLADQFKGLNRVYLQAALAAMICGKCGKGTVPMIAAQGPSGAGKEAHLQLASSFLAHTTAKIAATESEATFTRMLGAPLASRICFMIDEIGKLTNLKGPVRQILQISKAIDWRKLYSDGIRTTDTRMAIALTCVNFPVVFERSPELSRRMWVCRLYETLKVPRGVDLKQWRDECQENADLVNALVARVYQMCSDKEFAFDGVAEALELERFEDHQHGLRERLGCQLYQIARGERKPPILIDTKLHSTFAKGWIDCSRPPVKDLLDELVGAEDVDKPRELMQRIKDILESMAWNEVLGIPQPSIRCEVKRNGRMLGLRFAHRPGRRGTELLNRQLPPIPASVLQTKTTPADTPSDTAKGTDAAIDGTKPALVEKPLSTVPAEATS